MEQINFEDFHFNQQSRIVKEHLGYVTSKRSNLNEKTILI